MYLATTNKTTVPEILALSGGRAIHWVTLNSQAEGFVLPLQHTQTKKKLKKKLPAPILTPHDQALFNTMHRNNVIHIDQTYVIHSTEDGNKSFNSPLFSE